MSQATQTQRRGGWFGTFMLIVVVLTLLGAVLSRIAIDYGWYTPEWMKAALTPVVTVQSLPTQPVTTRAPAVQPTTPPTLPTPLPEGIVPGPAAPVIQSDPAAPQPAPVVTGPNPDAPAQIRTRGAVCFGGWWYLDGEKQDKSCSGTGGD